MKKLALLGLFASSVMMLFGTGCTVKTVKDPVTVTTKQLPELPAMEQAGKEVKGSSCSRVALLIIPVGFATAEDAYAEALGQAPQADTLISYEARSNLLYIFPFYYQVCTEVHGWAVISKK